MKLVRTIFVSFPLSAVLAACGGGGGDAGDIGSFSVLPSSFTWVAPSCPAGVIDAVSIHTINGGKSPFRVRSQTTGIEVGLVSPTNNFVQPDPSNFNGGDLVLTGKDPQFAVRSTLSCADKPNVLVLDDFSQVVEVSVTVEVAPDEE
jgi:hypothetical protein